MSSGRVVAAAGIYGTFAALAWAGAAATGASPWHLGHTLGGSHWISLPIAAGLGVGVGLGTVRVSRALVRHSDWGRALHRELRQGVLGLSPRAVAPLALVSAIGEELFFRGGLLAAFVNLWGAATGLLASTAVFALAHVPWNRRLLPWTATAFVMGLVFGVMYLATGELAASIAAHVVVNHANLRFILAYDPAPTLGRVATSRG
jgi:membrane protease YdiL (CAAX protease family)